MSGDKKDGVYVNAKSIQSDSGSFIGTDTMDLQEIMNKVGRYAQCTIAKPRNAKTPESRYVKFVASDAKYLPGNRSGGGSGKSSAASASSNSDEVL